MVGWDAPDWDSDGRDWPLRAASRFVVAGGMRWRVAVLGAGPDCLLIHGTGASSHSVAALAERLAGHFRVVAPDLPGQGFSERPSRLGLPDMARRMAALLAVMEVRPALAIGHSAGAAVALRLALDGAIAPHGIVSLNGALRPYQHVAAPLFSLAAKALFLNPLAPHVFALGATRQRVERLIENTGSRIAPAALAQYRRLFSRPGHVAGALGMMASWDLAPLIADLPRLQPRLLLVVGDDDRAVPPEVADEVARLVPGAAVAHMPRVGHLAHEEDPDGTARIVLDFAARVGVRAAAPAA